MKARILVGLAGLTLLVAVFLAYPRLTLRPPSEGGRLPTKMAVNGATQSLAESAPARRPTVGHSIEELRKADTAAELSEIEKWMDARDDKTWVALIGKMRHPTKEVRKAALEAVMQLDDKAAAPDLRQVAAGIANPDERAEVLRSADFLELPPAQLDFGKPKSVESGASSPPSRTHRFPLPSDLPR